MGPEWKGNEDVVEAILADSPTPLQRGLQTLRVWLEVAETEYAHGHPESLTDALEMIDRTCGELSPLVLSLQGAQREEATRYVTQAQAIVGAIRGGISRNDL